MSLPAILSEARAWQQALGYASQAKSTVSDHGKLATKDLKAIYRTQRYLSRSGKFGYGREFDLASRSKENRNYINHAAFATKTGKAAAQKVLDRQARIDSIQQGVRNDAVGRTAKRVAYGLLAAGAIGMGAKAISRFRKYNKTDDPQFRHYDVHPEYQYGVSPIERFNRPMYYDDEEIGTVVPRLREAYELPQRLTGFRQKRQRYRWAGIKQKIQGNSTQFKRMGSSKVSLKQTAKGAVQTRADLAQGRQAISRKVSTLPITEKTSMNISHLLAEATKITAKIRPTEQDVLRYPKAHRAYQIQRAKQASAGALIGGTLGFAYGGLGLSQMAGHIGNEVAYRAASALNKPRSMPDIKIDATGPGFFPKVSKTGGHTGVPILNTRRAQKVADAGRYAYFAPTAIGTVAGGIAGWKNKSRALNQSSVRDALKGNAAWQKKVSAHKKKYAQQNAAKAQIRAERAQQHALKLANEDVRQTLINMITEACV
jgi:hypothetical protein